MGVSGKHPQSASIASDLKTLFPVITTRRTKVFAYGFVLAFVACTAFLAFSPSGNASSPWFNTIFTSSTITSSIAPYRSRFSSLVSYFFPKSYSPSPETPIASQKPKYQVPTAVGSAGNGVGSQEDGILGHGLRGNGDPGKNRTEKPVGSAGNGVLVKNGAKEGVGSEKDEVSVVKNETGSGVGLQGHEAPARNQTAKVLGSERNGVSAKNQTKGGNGSEKVAASAGKNQTGSGIGLQGSVVGSRGTGVPVAKNQTGKGSASQGNGVPAKNQKDPTAGNQKNGVLEKNQTGSGIGLQGSGVGSRDTGVPVAKSQTGKGPASQGNGAPAKNQKDLTADTQKNGVLEKNQTAEGVNAGVKKSATKTGAAEHKVVAGGDRLSNFTVSPVKGNGSAAPVSNNGGQKRDEWIDNLMGCNIFQGKWVRDDSYPLYPEGSCPHIDEPFDCYHNGRPDRAYQKLRWQPDGCNIPRLNATDMLERLRGKRLVFVGDSLNRNMWESLVCALRHPVKDKTKVFEASGRHEFRTEGSYSFLFKDYGCTVEFFRSPFLVQEWELPGNNGSKKETLRLDLLERSASKYKDAYAIVFNTGHWWTHEKTSRGRDYYQEGTHVYSELNVAEAFHKALNTWAKWVDANVNPKKTHVFFRGYSASHFSGGQWNSGGQCNKETEPIKSEKYLRTYPPKMNILEEVIKGMKTPVSYLNITRMTDYRKDAHPSIYRMPKMTEEERALDKIQDCSHWCLPGVPDSWNELLYAQLLIKQHQMQH